MGGVPSKSEADIVKELCVVENPNDVAAMEKLNADELNIRSALRIYGFRDIDLDLIPTGVLDDFKNMVDNQQTAVVADFLKELGLDLKARIQLIKGLASLTDSAMDDDERQPSLLPYVPVWNVIDDIFFDKPPPNEMIKEILNLFGIMGALLFSLVCSIYTGLDPGRISDMTKNWKVRRSLVLHRLHPIRVPSTLTISPSLRTGARLVGPFQQGGSGGRRVLGLHGV